VFGPQTREMAHAVDTSRLGDSARAWLRRRPGLEALISPRSTLTLFEGRLNGRSHLLAVVGNRLRAVSSWELGSLPNRRPIVVIKESHRRAMNRRLRPASRSRCFLSAAPTLTSRRRSGNRQETQTRFDPECNSLGTRVERGLVTTEENSRRARDYRPRRSRSAAVRSQGVPRGSPSFGRCSLWPLGTPR